MNSLSAGADDGAAREQESESARPGLPSRDDVAGLPVPEATAAGRSAAAHPNASCTTTRRDVLKLMAASAILAVGGPGCDRKPYRQIVGMHESPEYQHPGAALYYASTWTDGAVPYGMKIKTLDGRPIKIEGLPDHPLNRGTASAAMLGSILSLYDPERLRGPRREGKEINWEEADSAVTDALRRASSVLLLTRATLGPSERAIVERFLAACPAARHMVYEPLNDAPRRSAWRTVYGADGEVWPRLSRAKVIVSLDADFLGVDGAVLDQIGDFAATRRLDPAAPDPKALSRLYVIESGMTVTGSNADHRIPLKPSAIGPLAEALRAALAGNEQPLAAFRDAHRLSTEAQEILGALLKDLRAHEGRAVVLGGAHLPEGVHASVALLNQEIGAPGKTLAWNPAPATLPVDAPEEIAAALAKGVDVLVTLGVNPIYDWPGGDRDGLFAKADLTVGHGLHLDETLAACTLALPSCHNLESWNDRAPLPGLTTLCQPVIAPLFDSRQEAESLLRWTSALAPEDEELKKAAGCWHDYLKNRWQNGTLAGAGEPQLAWEAALRKGMAGSAAIPAFPALRRNEAEQLAAIGAAGSGAPSATHGTDANAFELAIQPHHALWDGRFASIGWLHELPDPVSRLVWDNAASIAPATAERLGVTEGDWVALEHAGRVLRLPALVQPGVADGVVTTTLGHGRSASPVVGTGRGFNVAALLGAGITGHLAQVTLRALTPAEREAQEAPRFQLVRTQKAFSQQGRPIVIHASAKDLATDPACVKHRFHIPELKQLDNDWDYSGGPKWGMAIDLGACVGCGACVTACQAENNIPIVGKEECAVGREMHWIRIDRYDEGDGANPRVHQQPMLCQHCDNAPCESVCPVNATAHSHEGLNEQVYNRCVGTRYCANNCPYKVRRFNFYNYTKRLHKDTVQELAYNPQVTVRSRGVMEKCTFCVQRINEVKFKLKNEGREVPDGAIQPACQQACPAGAIVFGNLNDPESRVVRMGGSNLAYKVLEELNVRPNVAYLARIANPHPDVHVEDYGGGHGHGGGSSDADAADEHGKGGH